MEDFCASGVAIEVTHRSRRRLFGLAGVAPLREEVAPPRRQEPGRGRGRPRIVPIEAESPPPPVPECIPTPFERKAIDYSELEYWMANAERVIRDTRRTLDALARGEMVSAPPVSRFVKADDPDVGDGDDWLDPEIEDENEVL